MTRDELDRTLEDPAHYKEIWLRGSNGAHLCALINGDRGWLMYLRSSGDSGFSSRNPNEESIAGVEYRLSNGQRDVYPQNCTYGVEVLADAMRSFLVDGERPPEIEWHED